MALNLKGIKENLSVDKLKGLLKKDKSGSTQSVAWEKTTAKRSTSAPGSLKRGFENIQAVFQEGKAVLFVKQFVVLLVAFLIVFYATKGLKSHRDKIKDEMAKMEIEHMHRDEYVANKDHLLKLEPLFPDISQKKDWLLVHLKELFEKRKMQVTMDGESLEEPQSSYVVSVQPVTFKASFKEVGKLLADIENGSDFLRVTNLTLVKLTESENLGENNVSIQFGTVFPKTKYAPTLFKDYAQQMEKLKAQQQPEGDASSEGKAESKE